MDVQFWNLQRKYGDVTFVCGWLGEVEETQPQCQGTSTVNSPKGSMGECHCRRSRPRERPVCIARRELYEGCGGSGSHAQAQDDRAQERLLDLVPTRAL